MLKTNESIVEKLKYLKLDLNKIPEALTKQLPLKFRANRVYDESYKIYRYVNIDDIEILLVDSHKDEDLNKKYSESMPLKLYLNTTPDDEDDIIRHTIFLKMLKELDIEEVEQIEDIQQALNKKVPFEVKFDKNYLWEIYYSESTNKYFMLVPTKEVVNPTLFYLIKKKIQNKKDKIFLPISNLQYEGKILKKSEIEDLEKYIWLFTKQWVSVYEVEDYKGELSLQIVGNVKVYEQIESSFKISLNDKEEAKKFYNLLKALFILQTELPNHYNFETTIDKKGGLEFIYNSKKIEYKDLSEFLKKEYINYQKEIDKTKEEYQKSNNELVEIKNEIEKYSKEYSLKEKQIATYLQCKKSFFGKVKYFFGSKKKKQEEIDENKTKEEKTETVVESNEEFLVDIKRDLYTIEDIVIICSSLDKRVAEYKNAMADYKAQKLKLEIIKKKNENAKTYLEEIENHKKSIFEFWKFASKDEPLALDLGETAEEENNNKRHKVFIYEEDIEEFGKSVDEYQRKNLSKKEFDDIFKIINTNIELVNNLENADLIAKELNEKLESFKEKEVIYKKEDFDIFGSVLEDKTKIKMLGKNKHREIEKNIYKLLNINEDLTASELKDSLQESISSLEKTFEKLKAQIDMPIYFGIDDKESFDFLGLKICEINSLEAVENIDSDKISLYRFNIKENMPIIYLTNSVFYDNSNKTLPLGMDITKQALIDLKLFELELKDKKQIRITKEENGKNKIKNISIYEYNLKLK